MYRLSTAPSSKLAVRFFATSRHPSTPKFALNGYQLRSRSNLLSPVPKPTSFLNPATEQWSPRQFSARQFHSTSRNQGGPLLPFFAILLKASTSLEFARTASRIALTFVPLLLLKNHKSRRYLDSAEKKGLPGAEEKRPLILRKIRNRTLLFRALVLAPILLFWATLVASLERTPLTGRWRLILLSPEEEDQISEQLANGGWYQAVSEILTSECDNGQMPKIIPRDDWRYRWVESTLRRLENGIPVLQDESSVSPSWLDVGPGEIQLPPPAEHPLRPRPRASEYLRNFCEMTCGKATHPSAHVVTGPPYSLLVIDKPDASNAFSYGFGADGSGGVVVYSGFIDEILRETPVSSSPPMIQSVSEESSWWSHIFGFLGPSPSRSSHVTPTPEQTSQLAILLAHELSHLVLSHHLESLSSGSIIVPGVLSIATDLVRALLFPITMLFGPFVNDAVANIGKFGSGEAYKMHLLCSSRKQEIEADVVSTRLLAYAGFDPHSALKFWENRQDMTETAECGAGKIKAAKRANADSIEAATLDKLSYRSVFQMLGSSHPVNKVRVNWLKEEMDRWDVEKKAALAGPVKEGFNLENLIH